MKSKEHTQLLHLKRLIKAVGGKQAPDAHALDPEFLSTIISVVSLNVLALNQANARDNCLKFLGIDTAKSDLSLMSHGEISALAKELYERAFAAAPASVRHIMPAPLALTSDQMPPFRHFFKATTNLSLFHRETVIGHAYQLCSQLRRKGALKTVQSSNKEMSSEALISFTQLYTPDWVVDTLIDQTLPGQKDASKLNVIDPACGAGNFLLPAFDRLLELLMKKGMSESEAVEHLADNTLCGVDIDPYGVFITSLALTVRCLRLKKPLRISFAGLQLLDESSHNRSAILGTLDRNFDAVKNHPLSRRYSAVLTNPPYIGRKLLSRELKQLLREHYPHESHDIAVAFTRRCLELLKDDGRLGLITQSSLLHLPSAKEFRRHLIEGFHPTLAIEAGTGVFPLQSGEKIDSVILVVEKRKERAEKETLFVNLRQEKEKAAMLDSILADPDTSPLSYRRDIKAFQRFPNCQFNYSCPDAAIKLFEKLPQLGDFAEVRQGLATTDNERFVRYKWEVNPEEIGTVWFPYVKGAGSQRWFSPVVNVVKWENDGFEIKEAVKKAYPYLKGKVHWVVKNESYYFREGLSFSFVNNANFAVRLLPAGCIFDVAASALFPTNIDRFALLAFLNSSFAGKMAHLINPTINFQVGDVKRLPIVSFSKEEQESLAQLAAECVKATEAITLEKDVHTLQQLQMTEARIDAVVLSAINERSILTESEFQDLTNWIARKPKYEISSALELSRSRS